MSIPCASPYVRACSALALFVLGLIPRAHAVPVVQSSVVDPVPLRAGTSFRINARVVDAVQGVATVDFRPWSTNVLRVVLSQQAGVWVGTGIIPSRLAQVVGAEATVKLLFLDAARQRAERTLRIPVITGTGPTAVYSPQTGELLVTGTGSGDFLSVGREGGGRLHVNGGAIPILGGVPTVLNTRSIRMLGLEGGDQLVLDESGGPLPAAFLLGGPGDDTLVGGTSDDTLQGDEGADNLLGLRGNDTLSGGAGDDTLDWSFGEGNDVVDGQEGVDRWRITLTETSDQVQLEDGGGWLKTTLNGGSTVLSAYHVERMEITPRTGADQITVNPLFGTEVSEIHLDLINSARTPVGDGAVDTITLVGTEGVDGLIVRRDTVGTRGITVQGLGAVVKIVRATAVEDRLVLDLKGGDDTVIAEEMPSGELALEVYAGPGADLIRGGAGNDLVLGGEGRDVFDGGDGNDTMVWNSGDGDDVFEAAGGLDTLIVHGSDAPESFGVSGSGGRVRVVRNLQNVT
ncbi:MAG: calcium-binding protein, partial [Verrucomicrobiales bacterium]|nr:calcium-binding protein [Verrucomicrobiales bacterium]